ncbi:imidazolonepropionase [Pseudemcibacter aquimaris]|uniref:imidazolonepropionase n=1 Tax=Pseudemcibacter aquimaris TaxID=2857064 RepID=UPI002010EF8B|nr:imidazolonepropionase [Pseudemcibacter aquimaris]MCC3861991.1 imidazolonepropionase [Pseudemcibacter aquimaris]WDU58743.1 imidazolonepropionase [Pseudemcibacter aquimaris]
MADKIWTNVNLITMQDNGHAYGLMENVSMVIEHDYIAWIGPEEEIPNHYDYEMESTDGDYMTPGLIDCHTHLIYGGNRIDEFELRLKGASYEEIAKSGGGILSTVNATRAATEGDLIESAKKRLTHFKSEGVTTIEIKSGYGLDLDTELKMLSAARALNISPAIDVIPTFLGAHALPPEFKDNRQGYIDLIVEEMLPKIAELNMTKAVDGFCENIGFTYPEMEQIFTRAKELGFDLKLHAEQLSDQQGAALAAKYGALSADHLEHLTEESIIQMKEAGTTAVLLPGAFYFLRDTKCPPIDLLRKHDVPMAVASDSNPGSSPALSLKLMINMATTLFKLTPEEALAGVTRNAAKALGLNDRGMIKEGMLADLVRWDISHPAELAYHFGGNQVKAVYKNGEQVL